ncbi:hypothetical protein D9M70_546710 [compost metagenome]
MVMPKTKKQTPRSAKLGSRRLDGAASAAAASPVWRSGSILAKKTLIGNMTAAASGTAHSGATWTAAKPTPIRLPVMMPRLQKP